MTNKELQKLSRKDLLEMLLSQSKQLQTLEGKYASAQAALEERTIRLERSGSIAEAALQLNGVFEAAQAACQQYTQSIAALSQEQETICARREAESREQAEEILTQAQQQREALLQQTQQECADMVQKAKQESHAYWEAVFAKLQTVSKEYTELQGLLSRMAGKGEDL